MENEKLWYKSKTIWVNLLAVVAIIVNGLWGVDMDSETQAALATGILAGVNLVLRLITKDPIRPIGLK